MTPARCTRLLGLAYLVVDDRLLFNALGFVSLVSAVVALLLGAILKPTTLKAMTRSYIMFSI